MPQEVYKVAYLRLPCPHKTNILVTSYIDNTCRYTVNIETRCLFSSLTLFKTFRGRNLAPPSRIVFATSQRAGAAPRAAADDSNRLALYRINSFGARFQQLNTSTLDTHWLQMHSVPLTHARNTAHSFFSGSRLSKRRKAGDITVIDSRGE